MGGLLSRKSFEAVHEVSIALDADRPEIFTVIARSLAATSDRLAAEPRSQLEPRPDGRQVRVHAKS